MSGTTVLVLNTGSSSLKYELFQVGTWMSLAAGLVERIGESESRWQHRGQDSRGLTCEMGRLQALRDHQDALAQVHKVLQESGVWRQSGALIAIGHRVVHGGDVFSQPVLIDRAVMETIRAQIPLAPLHNPANLVGIEAALAAHPHVPQVAVFDTAFHQSLPAYAYRYALPDKAYRDHQVRRYGFHGTSHQSVSAQAAGYLNRPLRSLNMISLHLGNGASATAIRHGESIDTSMGMTPLEGLVMGTRCGDLDPAIVFYLVRMSGMGNDQVERMLNRESGLKGICGDNDMREVLRRANDGDQNARLAVQMFAYRVQKYIGAYYAVLGRLDALLFTAGIGENSPEIRAACCQDLDHLGIVIDPRKNNVRSAELREIQSDEGRCKILVVPTDEEREIARQTVQVVDGRGSAD